MRLHSFGKATEGGVTRVHATVEWEERDEPEEQISIETEERFADDIDCNPNAFLLAAVIPARRFGERRVLVEGNVCPELRNGLTIALETLGIWFGEPAHGRLSIEASAGFEPLLPRTPARTASFMSGGVDAMATFRRNRLDYPLDHPASIRDCFFVHGIDVGGWKSFPDNRENSRSAIAELNRFSDRSDATLIPVFTNFRRLAEDQLLFYREFYGAALAAVAQAFSRRITRALIASGYSVADVLRTPNGSHPLLDPNYSTSAVSIRHDGLRYSRLQKVGLLAEWDLGLEHLRACNSYFRPAGVRNCCECEKCLRTMCELVLHGKLENAAGYPDELSSEMLQSLEPDLERIVQDVHRRAIDVTGQEAQPAFRALSAASIDYWRELAEPLRSIGRDDLARVVESKVEEYDKIHRADQRSIWRALITRVDQSLLSGAMAKRIRARRVLQSR